MPLSDQQLASRAGIPTPVLAAIRRIESSGNPRAVRFETRLFRERTGQTIEGSSRAVFETAYRVNPQAAVESSSFGLYQVLGSALIRLYGSPAAGLAAFDANPRDVSDALLVEWFRARPAAQAAANNANYQELARLYNGSSTTPWYGRFMAALGQARPAAAAGGALVLGAALFAGWAYWKSRQRATLRRRRRGGLGEYDTVTEYAAEPRPGARRRKFCEPFKVRVSRECDSNGYCDVLAEAETFGGKVLGTVEAKQRDGSPYLTIAFASMISGGNSIHTEDPDNYAGCGVGTRLYEALASYSCDEGLVMRSDIELTRHSRNFWEKQVAKGRAYPDGLTISGGRELPARYVLKQACRNTDLSGLKRRRRKRRA